jgi:hypothetical protein
MVPERTFRPPDPQVHVVRRAVALQNFNACLSVIYTLSIPVVPLTQLFADMFSYYGIAAGVTISIINYVLLGFQFPVDGFYMHSFEIWLATTVVFYGSGNLGFTLLEYRLGDKPLVRGRGPPVTSATLLTFPTPHSGVVSSRISCGFHFCEFLGC